MARARSRAPRERQYPTVYITWKLLYILATSFCKVQQPVRPGGGGGLPPPPPPALLHPPLADLDLNLVVVHLALGGISPRLPLGPTHPLPIGPAPLVDEAVLHWGGRLQSAPHCVGPPPPTPRCSYLYGTRAGTRGKRCWLWCWGRCLASRNTCRRSYYRPALQRQAQGRGSSAVQRSPSRPLSEVP